MTVSLLDVLELDRTARLAILGETGAARRILFALAHAIAGKGDRVVTLALDRFRVPTPAECEACVADAHVEVAYRDTIERLKYFTHVHAGIGGSGGYVTTRTSTIGRFYSPTPQGLVTAFARNPAMPFVLLHAGRLDATPPAASTPPGFDRFLLVEGHEPIDDAGWRALAETASDATRSTTATSAHGIVALARGSESEGTTRAAGILAAAPEVEVVGFVPSDSELRNESEWLEVTGILRRGGD